MTDKIEFIKQKYLGTQFQTMFGRLRVTEIVVLDNPNEIVMKLATTKRGNMIKSRLYHRSKVILQLWIYYNIRCKIISPFEPDWFDYIHHIY